jgi:hypothetical protein
MSTQSNALVIPPAIARFLKRSPLLVTESRQDYEAFFDSVAQAIAPTNNLEWIQTGSFVDQKWELKRLRCAKAAIINATRREAFQTVFESILPETDDRIGIAADMADQWFRNPSKRPILLELLKKDDLDDDAISAQALAMRAPELEIIDREIQRLEICSMAQLREIEFHRRASTWRASKGLVQVIDAVAESIPLQPAHGNAHVGGAQVPQVEEECP